MSTSSSATPIVIRAATAKRLASLFDYGNLIAILLPMPLGVLWLGGSIAVYTMLRHHPHPRVGHYTQWAAYRFYGVVGFVVVVATFFSTSLLAWIVTWALSALIIIPWTIVDLLRIRREDWQDIIVEKETTPEENP